MKGPWADKKLGQHFLNNSHTISSILSTYQNRNAFILEIGPGPGALSFHLHKLSDRYFAIEKDQRFLPLLEQQISPHSIILADALEIDYQKFFNDNHLASAGHLISNLPYNIAAPLIRRFLELSNIHAMTLMMQKEFGERLLAFAKKDKGMNSLRALVQNFFKVKKVCLVPPGHFSPPPKVDSVVLYFERKHSPVIGLEELENFEVFTRHLFSQKRKQLGSVLKLRYAREVLDKLRQEVDLTVRAEKFSLEEVYRLYRILEK